VTSHAAPVRAEDGGAAGRAFFLAEYRLNHLLFTYPKPMVTFMDGITMGGGSACRCPRAGGSRPRAHPAGHARNRDRPVPDVGGGWFLSRLKGRLGHYMALTGARLDGAECCWAGLASHICPPRVLAGQGADRWRGEVATVLDDLATPPARRRLRPMPPDIARHFARYAGGIWRAGPRSAPWATQTLATLKTRAPPPARSRAQLQESLALPDFAANMAMDTGSRRG
jgi:enoyl-CoA hydratase